MNKKKIEYFGIHINNKIPKLDNKENKYYKDVKFEFDGEAYILDKNNSDINERIENGDKINKKGKYIVKFTNSKLETYYIKIKRSRVGLIIFIFLLLGIILGSINCIFNNKGIDNPKNIINQVIDYNIELEGIKYVFNVSFKNQEFKSIELTDKVSDNKFIYPGSSGFFYIEINTKNGNKDMFYTMKVREEKNKPTNLKFEIDGKVYDSMQELAKNVNGSIDKDSHKILKIKWFWEYETEDDITDTEDGKNIETYKVYINMIGEAK